VENLAISDTVRIVVYCRDENQEALNVSYGLITSITAGPISYQLAADTLSQYFADAYKPVLSVNARYQGLSLQRLLPLPQTDPFNSTVGAGVGTVTGDTLPSQTSGVISLRTGLAGRSFRGRKYIPFPGEASNDATGFPTAAYKANLATLAGLYTGINGFIVDTPTAFNLEATIFSLVNGAFYPVESNVIRSQWGTQRRRSQINKGDSPFAG